MRLTGLPGHRRPVTRSRLAGPGLFVLTGLAYLALAQFILILNDPIQVGAGFWPAAGMTVAILLLIPTRLWPWPLAGVVLAEAAGDYAHGYPLAGIPWWTAGNTLEPLLGAYLVRRFASPRGALTPLRNLLAFIALAVVVAPLVGATIGSVGTAGYYMDLTWSEVWPKYVVGDALGVLVVAPVILTAHGPRFRRRGVESLAVGAALTVTAVATLRDWPGALDLVTPYFVIPFLTWAALRFGIRGSARFVFLLAQFMSLANAFGYGPFVHLAVSDAGAVTMLQIFLLIAAASTFVLAALAEELSDRDEVQGLLRALADSMPQLVWVANGDGTIEYYNRRSSAYHALTDAWTPFHWQASMHPDDLQATLSVWDRARAERGVFEAEHRMQMADGSYRWHLSRAERVEAIDRVQWYGTSTDIHDLKLADELKDQFIAIASHELRNPVAAIHGLAQQIRRARDRDSLTPERIDAYTDALLRSSSYLARLTQDLTDVSRLQRGTLPLRLEPTDLAQLVVSIMASEEWPVERLHPRLEADLGTVVVDPARARQLLSNLIDNALKYSGGEEPVEICARREGEGVLVQVVDRGIGLPPDAVERIFTPFGRAVNTGSVPGLGMGLYVAREIAERHGGRLWATSDGEGRGTTLHLWLPMRPPELSTPE